MLQMLELRRHQRMLIVGSSSENPHCDAFGLKFKSDDGQELTGVGECSRGDLELACECGLLMLLFCDYFV